MFVSLKVPDNVTITAFNTLKRMNYKLKKLERSDYYKFDVKDNVENFKKQISKVDILVNSNKNKFSFSLEKNNNKKNNARKSEILGNKVSSTTNVVSGTNFVGYKIINILIQDIENGSSLLSTLKERLGFTNIKKLEKGILWTMYFEKRADIKNAVDITKNLLMNDNYQKYKVIG